MVKIICKTSLYIHTHNAGISSCILIAQLYAMVIALSQGKGIPVPNSWVQHRPCLVTLATVIFRYKTSDPPLLVQFLPLRSGYMYV
jgi:hypothetical protein